MYQKEVYLIYFILKKEHLMKMSNLVLLMKWLWQYNTYILEEFYIVI